MNEPLFVWQIPSVVFDKTSTRSRVAVRELVTSNHCEISAVTAALPQRLSTGGPPHLLECDEAAKSQAGLINELRHLISKGEPRYENNGVQCASDNLLALGGLHGKRKH